eukprot:5438254-Amphidinium_carterae.2
MHLVVVSRAHYQVKFHKAIELRWSAIASAFCSMDKWRCVEATVVLVGELQILMDPSTEVCNL